MKPRQHTPFTTGMALYKDFVEILKEERACLPCSANAIDNIICNHTKHSRRTSGGNGATLRYERLKIIPTVPSFIAWANALGFDVQLVRKDYK